MTDASAQEPAVDARAVAIEVIARAIAADVDESEDWGTYRWAGADALDALLSPTKKPCAWCGGNLIPEVVDPNCGICNGDGFVLGPTPIEGLLKQVGHWNWDHRGFYFDPEFVADVSWPVFRLPSKVSGE